MHELPLDERVAERARAVCRAWFGRHVLALEPLAAGFSGSLPLVVRAGSSAWVLKSFPPAAGATRAAWVHALMRHVRGVGVAEVPALLAARDGSTFCHCGDAIWELASFVPGSSTAAPTTAQAVAAARTLARIHRAAATLPGEPPRQAPSPALAERISRVAVLLGDPWAGRPAGLATGANASLLVAVAARFGAAREIFRAEDGLRLLRGWASVEPLPMPLQPVMRDVWCDHVLFTPGDPARVAGVIDFHAAGVDTPVADVARLLGSWRSPVDRRSLPLDARWAGALAAYEDVKPLTDQERRLVPELHAMGVVFGLDNWFRWTLGERREFPDESRVLGRIDWLLGELPAALAFLGGRRVGRV
jgi:Ser/Thr protein kinase RdoA (MazF antagonist)